MIVDSTGFKVCGQGEWHTQKHGEKKQKRWKKLHIGADGQGQIIASTVTESHEQDPSQVPALISQVERGIARFIGDGLYDHAPVYAAVETHSPGARVIIPPRKDAVLSPSAMTTPSQRDQHLVVIEDEGRSAWPSRSKRQIFYGKEELCENLLMSPIPYSFQEQEDTRAIPREGRHQVGHLLASVPSPPRFSSL